MQQNEIIISSKGGIDTNVHLQKPTTIRDESADLDEKTVSIDDFYQGSRAALIGGTTTLIDTVVPEKGESLQVRFQNFSDLFFRLLILIFVLLVKDAYAKWRGWAEDKVCCNYALKMGLNSVPTQEELEALSSEEFGINCFHMSMAGEDRMNDSELIEALDLTLRVGGLAQIHAESGEIIAREERVLLSKGMSSFGLPYLVLNI